MNKAFSLSLAGAALIAVALTGCKGSSGVSASTASQRARALSTSSQAAEAEAAGKDLAGTCLPAKDLNRAYFVQLALNLKTAKALGAKCEVPEKQLPAFSKAVISSASQAYLSGNFKTQAQRVAWAEKDLPVIVEKYQGKS